MTRTLSTHASARLHAVAAACALLLAPVAASTVPGTAHAQAAQQAIELNLPAQPLGAALNALSRHAGVPVAVDASLVEGRSAPGVSGRLTLREALQRVLAGSGLVAVEVGGRIEVRNAPAPVQQTEALLPAVTVRAGADPLPSEALRPFAGGQVARGGQAGVLGSRDMLETPFSITAFARGALGVARRPTNSGQDRAQAQPYDEGPNAGSGSLGKQGKLDQSNAPGPHGRHGKGERFSTRRGRPLMREERTMWMLWVRTPRAEVPYWTGRRWWAAVDALLWPVGWVWLLGQAPPPAGLLVPVGTALALMAALARLQRALWVNHRYHFTTWRSGKVVAALVLFGALLKVAVTM